MTEPGRLPPQLMSQFYKSFLEERRTLHVHYNFAWWRRALWQIPLYINAYLSRVVPFLYAKASDPADEDHGCCTCGRNLGEPFADNNIDSAQQPAQQNQHKQQQERGKTAQEQGAATQDEL